MPRNEEKKLEQHCSGPIGIVEIDRRGRTLDHSIIRGRYYKNSGFGRDKFQVRITVLDLPTSGPWLLGGSGRDDSDIGFHVVPVTSAIDAGLDSLKYSTGNIMNII